jgi:hypothetical protein
LGEKDCVGSIDEFESFILQQFSERFCMKRLDCNRV